MDQSTRHALISAVYGVLKQHLPKLRSDSRFPDNVAHLLFAGFGGAVEHRFAWSLTRRNGERSLLILTGPDTEAIILPEAWITGIQSVTRVIPDLKPSDIALRWADGRIVDHPLWPYVQAGQDSDGRYPVPMARTASTLRYLTAPATDVGVSKEIAWGFKAALEIHRLAVGTGITVASPGMLDFTTVSDLSVVSLQPGRPSPLRMQASRRIIEIALAVTENPGLRTILDTLPAEPAPATTPPSSPGATPSKSWLSKLMGG